MKQCATCENNWPNDMVFCPSDGNRLSEVEETHFMIETESLLTASANQSITFDLTKCQKYIPETPGLKPLENEPQFILFPEFTVPDNSDETRTRTALQQQSSVSILIQNAITALEHKRRRDQNKLKENVKLFGRFNLYCNAVWDFVSDLEERTESFSCGFDHLDEPTHLWVRFTLMLGEGRYARCFPITVTYQREPWYEATLKINLYEIGQNHNQRVQRTEQVPEGKFESTRFGVSYLVTAPPTLTDRVQLVKWLKRTFDAVFRLTYTD